MDTLSSSFVGIFVVEVVVQTITVLREVIFVCGYHHSVTFFTSGTLLANKLVAMANIFLCSLVACVENVMLKIDLLF